MPNEVLTTYNPHSFLTDLNPEFGGPWGMLWVFFVNGTFIMPQKKSFGQKIFWISCTGSKVPFWQNGKIAKMALLNRCMKFKSFFGQKTSFKALWKCHLLKIFLTFSRVWQIQDLGQSKYKLRLFSRRTHGISKTHLGFLWISSKSGKQNWRVPFFWVFIIVKR